MPPHVYAATYPSVLFVYAQKLQRNSHMSWLTQTSCHYMVWKSVTKWVLRLLVLAANAFIVIESRSQPSPHCSFCAVCVEKVFPCCMILTDVCIKFSHMMNAFTFNGTSLSFISFILCWNCKCITSHFQLCCFCLGRLYDIEYI